MTNSLFQPKLGSAGSNAIAFADPDVASVTSSAHSRGRRDAPEPVKAALPAWLLPTICALEDLLHLPGNWDGYGAVRIKEQIAENALLVLVEIMEDDAPVPSVVPLSDGGIQVEWHRRGRNLEIEFPADEAPAFYYYEDRKESECEGPVYRSFGQIEALLASMK
jgi:hypothetical protein